MNVYNWDGRGFAYMIQDLIHTEVIHTGEWQAMDTRKSKAHGTHELEDVTFVLLAPDSKKGAQILLHPDLPWAEDHFQERVSGIPHNPAPSHAWWPYAVGGNARHMAGGVFDHTYPERFWPTHAGLGNMPYPPVFEGNHHKGIRFDYGNLMDVVAMLLRSPHTRQAYLPVWFPEDTGARAGQRVPCTLGYHFMIRNGQLSCRYYMRSCDVYRHLTNDVYLAVRLMQWVCDQVNEQWDKINHPPHGQGMVPDRIYPGKLVMHIASLHLFENDVKHYTHLEGDARSRTLAMLKQAKADGAIIVREVFPDAS